MSHNTFEQVGAPTPSVDISEKRGERYISEPIAADPEKRNSFSEQSYQRGVLRARGITSTWSKTTLWTIFVLLYIVSFVDQFLVAVDGAVGPYMTSLFQSHGLTATLNIISTIASGTCALTLAKVADVYGRVQAYILVLVILLVGQVMKAAAQNVLTFAAGQIFFWVGHTGLLFIIDIILADSTTLRNRMIMIGLNGTPLIASVFAGPPIAQHFIETNIRWAYGTFIILIFAVSIPPVVILLMEERKAYKNGAIQDVQSGRTWFQSIGHYFIQFDIFGIFLITAAFALFLLPFSLASYAPDGWSTGYIIAMMVLGILLFPAFYVWERFFTPVNFLKWEFLQERTIVGSCILFAIMFASTFSWNAYFRSYLQVVNGLSVTTADYTLNAYSLSAAFVAPLIGVALRYTGKFKWVAYAGFPILLLGTALLIPFRSPGTDVGLLVMTQLFVGIGAQFFVSCGQLAVMSIVTQQEVAAVLAVWNLFGSAGASIGYAIAGAIWTNTMPTELANRLPADAGYTAAEVYADITVQLSFAQGTPERDAIVGAYGHVQRLMVITGVALIPICLSAIIVWRNVDVKKLERSKGKQTAGNVF